MRRAACLAIALLALIPAPARAANACPALRCRDVRVPVPAGLRVPESRARVLLPAAYDGTRTRYPVVYLLHGVGDTYKSWTELTDLVAFSRRIRAIIVMPDGGRGSEAGWYSDWKDRSRHWETFHTKVLVSYIDKAFRTLGARHRAVVGNSMGGFGAMSYAARHRKLFRAAASLSGAVDTMYAAPASGVGYETFAAQFGTPDDRVWGDQLSDEEKWREHNPTDRAPDLRGVRLDIASGMGAPGGSEGDEPSRLPNYGVENAIFQMNLSFTRALDEAGVKYSTNFYPGGYHHWTYWQRELHRVLPSIVKTID